MWSQLMKKIWYCSGMQGSLYVVIEDGERFKVDSERPLTLDMLKRAIGVS